MDILMRTRTFVLAAVVVPLSGCAMTTGLAQKELRPGMSTAQVRRLLGDPDSRSFQGSDQACQYYDVVGFGECEYLTAWFARRHWWPRPRDVGAALPDAVSVLGR